MITAGDTNVTQYTWDADSRWSRSPRSTTYGGALTQTVAYLYDAEGRWIGEKSRTAPAWSRTRPASSTTATRSSCSSTKVVTVQMTNAELSAIVTSGVRRWTNSCPTSNLAAVFGAGLQRVCARHVVWPLTDNVGTVRDLAICDLTAGTTAVVNHLELQFLRAVAQPDEPCHGQYGGGGLPVRFHWTATGHEHRLAEQRPSLVQRQPWALGKPRPDGFTAGDTNLYRYCGNSPANAVDPSWAGRLDDLQWAVEGDSWLR